LLEKQKEEFIAIASHELKTPVTSIKAYAEILEDVFTASKDGESKEMVKKLGNQVDRLTNLVKDLLDVTKITEGQLKLVEDFYDINEAILETVEDMQLTTKKHKIVTQLDPADRLWGDRSRIEQVLVNLISNAIKYSPEGEKVIITSKADEEGVTISVEDFGIGMSKEVQQQIFERFYRVSGTEANTFPGLGLGLYISTEVIRRQGGRIWVTSEQNKGSVFGFFLPYKRP
jgi:signal transduction histidine kinase